ncbi:MAG: tetratricopeptide repeat protein [Planctomycetota bacterium]
MTTHLARAQLLLQHDRFDEAAGVLRQGLAQNPDDALTHAMLGYALTERAEAEELGEAEGHLGRAIMLSPDLPFAYYAMGTLRLKQRDATRARQDVDAALRLDPYDADHYALRAQIEIAARRWADAAEWAEKGLAVDAEHMACTNIRALALSNLGRRDEANRAIDAALKTAPEDSYAHANRGWSELHAGRPRPAMKHFKEALRLEPTNEFARAGMVEALKARNPVYRIVLAFFLWMMRLPPKVQVGVLVGGFLGYQVLLQVNASVPAARIVTLPLVIAYFVFAVLTWVSVPLFNLTLMLSRYGRAAMSVRQKRGALIFGGFLALPVVWFVGGLALAIATGSRTVGVVTGSYLIELAFLLLPASAAANAVGTPRFRLFGGIVLGLIVLLAARVIGDLNGFDTAGLARMYTYAFIAAVWGMILLGVRPEVR